MLRCFRVLLFFLAPVSAVVAQDSAARVTDLLRQAESSYQAEQWVAAEAAYSQALPLSNAAQRPLCLDRLTSIYSKVGRWDRAIQTGLELETSRIKANEKEKLPPLHLQIGNAYFQLGQYLDASRYLEKQVSVNSQLVTFEQRLDGIEGLAKSYEILHDARAEATWKQGDLLILQPLPSTVKTDRRRKIRVLLWHANSQAHRRQWENVSETVALIRAEIKLGLDWNLDRDVADLEAKTHEAKGAWELAHSALVQAVAAHEKTNEEPERLGDLARRLADVAVHRRNLKDKAIWQARAINAYTELLKNPQRYPRGSINRFDTYTKLQSLYHSAQQPLNALQLANAQAEEWGATTLLQSKWNLERGRARVQLGQYRLAEADLRNALQGLEKQVPTNLNELRRVLYNLAAASMARDQAGETRRLLERCVETFPNRRMDEDLFQIDVESMLGMCDFLDGKNTEAIQRFRTALELCDRKASSADSRRGSIYLNFALVHKTQGETARALEWSLKAREQILQREEPDSLIVAQIDASIATIYLIQGKIQEAYRFTEQLLPICEKHQIHGGPMVLAAKHIAAVMHVSKKRYGEAERLWLEALDQLQKENFELLIPRTLNYLGLVADLKNEGKLAESYFREARALQEKASRSFPPTHFITLWQLATLLDREKKSDEARTVLAEALRMVEKARLQTFGDAAPRAQFFAQFSTGFEQLIDWHLRAGDPAAALGVVAQSRSRTLADQLQMAGADPRLQLQDAKGQALIARENAIKKKLATLRARASWIAADGEETEQVKRLVADFEKAQMDYAEVYREIINASPTYRNLSNQEFSAKDLQRLQSAYLGSKKVLLAYHLGEIRSQVFLVSQRGVEVFPLRLRKDVAQHASLPEPLALELALAGSRGIRTRERLASVSAELPPNDPNVKNPPQVALNDRLAKVLVDHYRYQMLDDNFSLKRGIRLKSNTNAPAVPVQPISFPGHTFLPGPLIQRIQELAPEFVIVIPDGSLHQVPLEAFVLEQGNAPRYAMDVLPPLIYAPSLGVLSALLERPKVKDVGEVSVLTVGNPAYPQQPSSDKAPGQGLKSRAVLTFNGSLPLLPGSARESKNLTKHFGMANVLTLQSGDATERNLVQSVRGKKIIHIAAHGFADEQFSNLFGAIALTPPKVPTEEEDGFLTLSEIYTLPLQACDLVVLSACVTNVGPQQKLEAGITLSTGFLAAGARHVVGSHWSVDDRSTAELIDHFFLTVRARESQGDLFSYASALNLARRHVRKNAEWSAPYHWAPFVLIGSGQP